MTQHQIIEKTKKFVQQQLASDHTGHDWAHVERVWKYASKLAKKEGGDRLVIELSALLHDIADWKFNKGDLTKGPKMAESWLRKHKLPEDSIQRIKEIIHDVTFVGAWKKQRPRSIEGKIVQDADRLDAIGAIGIARAFAYGAKIGRKMYDREIKPQLHKSFEDYKKGGETTINHFFEKLLRLRSSMNTRAAKALAKERHQYIEKFVKRFITEWHGK